MTILKYLSWFVVALNFVALTLFTARRTPEKQLLFMTILGGSLFFLAICFIAGLRFFSRDKFRAFLPVVICLAGLPISLFVAGRLGDSIENWRFEKNLSRYTKVVQLVEKGEFKTDSSLVDYLRNILTSL